MRDQSGVRPSSGAARDDGPPPLFSGCQSIIGSPGRHRHRRLDSLTPTRKAMKPKKPMESLLLTRRGPKVILAAGWAELYGVANRLRPRLAASRASTPKTNNTRTETQLLPARGPRPQTAGRPHRRMEPRQHGRGAFDGGPTCITLSNRCTAGWWNRAAPGSGRADSFKKWPTTATTCFRPAARRAAPRPPPPPVRPPATSSG